MPYRVQLSRVLRKAGWTAKVYDAEGAEEPHVTVRAKTKTWRISLRTGNLLDAAGRMSEIEEDVLAAIRDPNTIQAMTGYWNSRNPHNPV
jgi:hypothetical protein